MIRKNFTEKTKPSLRIAAGAALMAVSLLFTSCPREIGLGGAVDTQKPVVSITSPDVDAVVKDTITLSGKASDETGLDSVTVKFQSTEDSSYSKSYTANIDSKAGTWTLTVNTEDATNGLRDSKYEVNVTALDKSGKTSVAARSFQIDNSAPAILVTKPSTYGGNNEKETVTFYKMVEIRGETYDASSIQEVRVGLYKGDGSLITEKVADGTDTWSAIFYEADLQGKLSYSNGSNVSDPIYIYVKARDKAENISNYYYHKSDMYSILKTKKTAQSDELYFPTTSQIGYLDANRAALTVTGVKQDNTPISVDVTKAELDAAKHEVFSSSVAANYPRFLFTSAATASIEWNNIDTQSASIGIGSDILASIQPASDGSSVNLDSLKIKLVKPNGNAGGTPFTPEELSFDTLRMGEAVNLTIHIPLQHSTGVFDLVLYGETNGGTTIGYNYDDANPPAQPDLIENDGYVHNLAIESTDIIIQKYKPGIISASTVYPNPQPETSNANVWFVNGDYYILADVTGLSVNTDITLTVNDEPAISVPRTNLTGDWQGTTYENGGQILHLKYKVTNESMPNVATITLKAGAVTKQLNIEKDKTAPEVNITSPVHTRAYTDASGDAIVLKGTATDDGAGIKEVYYELGAGTNVAKPGTSSGKAKKTGSNWSIDWPSSNDEGTYTLKVVAQDNLGKLGDVQTVMFYKDASDPGLTEVNVGSAGLTATGDFELKGKAWDTNKIDEITVSATVNGVAKIWSSKEGGSTAADSTGKIKAVNLNSEINSKVASDAQVTADNWSIKFTTGSNSSGAAYIADGTTSFTITIKDAAGKSKAYTRTVTVDTVKPKITNPKFATGVVGKDENAYNTLTVEVEDPLKDGNASGIERVYYQIMDTKPEFTNETNWTAMAVGGSGYTANVNFSTVTENITKKAWIAAKDIAGNTFVYETPVETFIDQHKPVLSVEAGSDVNYNRQFTDDVKIIVRLTDTNPKDITASDITVKKPNGTKIDSITGDIKVTKTADTSDYKEFEIKIPFKTKPDYFKESDAFVDGTYTVTIGGKDVKNRAAESVTHSILMDTSEPAVEITNYKSETYTNVGSIIVEGTVFDANLQKVEAWIEGDSRQDITAICVPDSEYAGTADADKHLKFSWTKYVGEGTYVAHIQATDTAQATNDPNTGNPDAAGQKTASITVDLTDPVSTLKQKTASTIYTEAGTAISDAATELTGTDIYLAKGAFTLKGVITEKNLKSAKLTVKKDNGIPTEYNLYSLDTSNQVVPPSTGCTWAGGTDTHTWEYTQDTTAGDGTYTYTLTLVDKAERTSTKNLTVKIDTTAPTVNITGPAADESFLTTPITIKGTAIDGGAGASKVYYTCDAPETVVNPTAASTAIDVNGSSWTADILGGASVTEGTYELRVIAADKLGNTSSAAVQSVTFSFDKNDPDLTETSVGDGGLTTTGNFTLKGKAWDTNKIDEITVSTTVKDIKKTWSSKNNGGVTLKPDSEVNSKVGSAAAVTADNWSITFMVGSGNESEATYIADGTTTFTITIKDIANKTRSYNRTVTVDTVKPSFPAGSTGFTDSVVGKDVNPYNTLTVKVDDTKKDGYASGLEGVYYQITEENASAPSFTSETGWTAMSQSSAGYTATVDFSAIDTDKSQKAWIAAKDRAGNRIVSTVSYSTFIDQQKPVMTVSGDNFTSKANDLTLTVRVTDTNPTPPTVDVYKPKSDGKAVGNVSDLTPYTRVDVEQTNDPNANTKIYVGLKISDGSYTDYKVSIPFKSNPDIFTPDGEYTVIINGKDAQNRAADQIAHEVLQDSLAPDVEITNYTSSTSIKVNSLTITGKATDANMTSVTAWLTKDGVDLDSVDITNTRKQDGTFSWTSYDLAEGVYVAHVVAKDQANQETAKETKNITVDLTAPATTLSRTSSSKLYTVEGNEVSETTLTNGTIYLAKTGFTLEGTLTEKYLKEAKLTVKKNNDTLLDGVDMKQPVGSRNTWTVVDAGAGTYKWTYTGGSDGDGSYFITIDLLDNAGNITQKTLTVKVDTTAPTLLVTTPGENQSSSIATITLRGTADDDGAGVSNVRYAYYDINADLSATPAPTPVGEGDADITGNTWKKEANFAAEGTYKLIVTATDKLGNKATTAAPITFSFDINDPELEETKIGNDSTITNGDTAKPFTLGGKAWDTNAIDEITVSTTVGGVKKTWSSKESGGKDNKILVSGMINTAIDSKKANAESVSADNWSITFKVGSTNSGDSMFIADGTNAFTIVITDIAGKTRSYNRTVTVDTTLPTISIAAGDGFPTGVIEQDASPYAALKVTANDPVQAVTGATATGLTGVYYKITLDDTQPAFASDADEAAWTAMTQGASGWSANVDFRDAAYADKNVRAWIAAKDRAGNRVVYTSSEPALRAFVDKMKPVLAVQSADDFTSCDIDLVMRVRVKDTNPKAPTITVYKPKSDGSAVSVNDLATAETVGISTFNVEEKGGNTTQADPYKEYEVTIPFNTSKSEFENKDGTYTIALNANDDKFRRADQITWTVLQDTTRPVINLTKYTSETPLNISTIAATATVTDANLTKVQAWLIKGGVVQDGSNGTEDTVETLYDKATGIDKGKNGSFNYTKYDLEDAVYEVVFKAWDAANQHTEAPTQSITVDTVAPVSTIEQNTADSLYGTDGNTVSETTLTQGGTYLSKAGYTLKGVITENHLKSAELTVTKDGTTLENELELTTISTSKGSWTAGTKTWTYIQSIAPTGGDGTYTYSLVLEDDAGNKTTETLTVKVDTTAPTLIITTPGADQPTSTTPMTIRGTVDDAGAGVKKVVYSYADATLSKEAVVNGNSWSDDISFTAEGSFTLYAKAVDNLGWESNTETVRFSYDKADPELKELRVGNDSTTVNTGFTLGGKAWDTNAIDEITISTSVNGEPKTWSTKTGTKKITLKPDSEVNSKVATEGEVTANNWSMDFVVGSSNDREANFIADGTNSFTIVIKDIAGKSRSYNRTITVDSTAPTLKVETGDGFASGLVEKDISAFVEVKVHAEDAAQSGTGTTATGLAGVYYLITDGSVTAAPSFTTETGWTAMSQGTEVWTANVNFSNITTDCSKKVWFAAKDRAGNRKVFTDTSTALKTNIDLKKPVLAVSGNTFTAAALDTADLPLTLTITDTNAPDASHLDLIEVAVYKPNDDGTALDLTNASEETKTAKKVALTSYQVTGPNGSEYVITIPFKSSSGKFDLDGNYTITVNAKDANGRAADQVTHIVQKDTSAPTVTLTNYQSAESTRVGTLTVTGTVTDNNLDTVIIWLNDDTANAEDITNKRNSTGNFTWTKYELTEGDYVVHVKATDKAGLSGSAQSATITVDTTAPKTSIEQNAANSLYTEAGEGVTATTLLASTATETDAGSYLAKAGFILKGVIDENQLASATLTVKKDNVEVSGSPFNLMQAGANNTWNSTTKTWTYTQAVNATSHANDGAYSYSIKLVDKAGNQTTKTVSVSVDTTKPAVSITKPGKNESFSTTGAIQLNGTASDAIAGINKVYYTTDGNAPTTSSAYATVTGNSWSVQSLTDITSEGKFKLQVMAEDKLGHTSEVSEVDFSYDKAYPELTETALASDGQTKNAGFRLSGRAWDSNKIDEITITAQGKTWSNKSGANQIQVASLITTAGITAGTKPTFAEVTEDNWGMDFVVGSSNAEEGNYLADGTIVFTITIKDIAGKSNSYNRSVTVDSKAPTISFDGTDGFALNADGKNVVWQDVSPRSMLNVTVSDDPQVTGGYKSGLEGVWYKITDTATAPESNDTTWTDIDAGDDGWTAMSQGTTKWSANVDFSDTVKYSLDHEQYAWIAAKDRAGNRTILTTPASTFVDMHKPVLSIDAVTNANFTDATANLEIIVRETDTNPTVPEVTVLKPKTDGTAGGDVLTATGVSVEEQTATAAYKEYKVTVPFKTSGNYGVDGTYTLKINASDQKNRAADEITWTVLKDQTAPVVELTSYTAETFTSNRTLVVTGKVKDDNLSSIVAWLDDNESGAEIITALLGAADTDGKQSFEWKQYDVSEGTHYVHVKATDRANLVNATDGAISAAITVDYTAPDSTFAYEGASAGDKLYTNMGSALNEPALAWGGSYLAKTGFTLKGVITEANFQDATLSIKKDNVDQPSQPINAAGAWSYVQAATDGTYEYTLTINDKANNQFKQTVTVKVDTTAPVLTVETPGEGQTTAETSMNITGSVTDAGAGNVTVLYSIDGSEPSVPATIIGSSWNDTINFSAQGAFVLKIKAKDVLGNETAVQTRNFSYDLDIPGIVENVVTNTGLTTNTGFTLGGKAWDTNAIDEITITGQGKTWSSKNAGEITLKPNSEVNSKVNAEADVSANNWSINFVVGSSNSSAATYVADGTIGFTITIKDVAGKKIDIARTVSIDTSTPVITEEASDGFTNGLVEKDVSPYNRLTIHASDEGTGLEGVYYQIAATKPAFATTADEAVWIAMAQGSGGAWTANADFSSVAANGDQLAWIAAKDRAGNRIVYAGKTVADDGSIKTYVDIMKPVLSIQKMDASPDIPDFTDAAADVNLRVRVTDTNPMAPTVSVKDAAGVTMTENGVSIVTDTKVDGSAGYKDYIVTVPFKSRPAAYSADGTYELTINGIDEKERAASPITHEILRDSSAPNVTLSSYQNITFTAVGTLTVQGSVSDSNLVKVEAWLEKDGVAQPVEDITNTLDNTGAFIWKQYDLDEAEYIVHVKATDKAHLTDEETSMSVTVDKTAASTEFERGPAPGQMGGQITWTAGTTYNQKDGYTLMGIVTESHLDSVNMTVKKDGTKIHDWTFIDNWTAYGNDPTGFEYGYDSSVQMFEIPVELDETDHTDDGTYVYSLTVIDKAGNREEKSLTVLVDTTAPTLIITKPAANEQLETGSYRFAGNVSDMGVGVKSVTYKLTNGGTEISSGNAAVTGASWTINGTGNTGIDLQSEGTLVIEVTATDNLDQSTVETTTFYYDQGAPTLTETEVGVSGRTTNAAFTLSGTASDTNALAGVDANGVAVGAISIYTGSGVSKVDYGTVDVAADGSWSKTFTPGSGTSAEAKLADGTYTFYITASDVSARETTVQRTVVVDTQAPAINKVGSNTAFITDIPTFTWFNKGTLALGATVKDNDGGSGASSVEYAVISNPTTAPTASDWQNAQFEGRDITWKSMTKGTASFTANAEVVDGMNYIVIRASDTAGNKTYTVQETAQVDTSEPSKVDVYEEQTCTTKVEHIVTNAQDAFNVYIKTKDAAANDETKEGSGVQSVIAKIGNKEFTSGTINTTKVASNVYRLTLSADALMAAGGSDNSQKTVYVRITDKAGNKSDDNLFTLQFDTVGPDIEFVSPATEDTASSTTVNKNITITGKANDLQGLQNVNLFYLYNDTDTGNKQQIGETKTGKDAANWSFTFDTTQLLNRVLANGEQSDLTLFAEATDTAGNISTESITIKVDQEKDIPIVTIAQPETLTGMTETSPVWLKGNNKITGTISDDDGVAGLKISTDNGANWTNIPVSGGYFQAQLSTDGNYTVLFKVTDTADGEFTSGDTGLTAVKLQDGSNPVGKSPDGKLYLTVDTETPQMLPTKYAFDGTSTTAADWTSALLADTTFGGTAHTEFTIKQYVFDENNIAKVEVSIDGDAFEAATKQTADTMADGGDTYTAYTYTVQTSSLETSLNHTIKIKVTDNADMTNEVSSSFKVDNDEPTVTLGSHSEEERVRGTLFVSGTTQDAPLYGPATSMLYKVTKTADTPTDWTTTLTTSTDYGAHVVDGNLASWRIYFDDDINNIDGYTHDRALKKILVQLDSSLEIASTGEHVGAVVWKNAGTGHAAGDLYTPLTMMYLHLKATDAYGNVTNFVRALELDPQGDIPSISIAYPSITGYGWKNGSNVVYTTAKLPEVGDSYYTDIADMTTAAGTVSDINRAAKTITCSGTMYTSYGGETIQGGIVRVQGTADGQNAIKAIYMQIDPDYNKTAGFNWDPSGNALMPNGAALSTRYTIVPFFEGSSMKGIKVGDSVSWSASLNRNTEFNGESGVQSHIGVRLYAVDIKNNVSPLNVADDIIITIDSDSPQVGSSEELYLYQYENNATGTGKVVASQKYEDDMWLKGEWWIQGSVEDASGIEPTLVSVQKQDGTLFTDYNFTKTQKSWDVSNTSGYVVKFKIGSSDENDFGKLVYQISATDKDTGNAKHVAKQISINFDNAAPILATQGHEDYNINHEVVQSNGFYTLGSSVSETGNATSSQSGFERLALYFVRPGSTPGTGTLYDTYFLKSSANNNMQLSSLTYSEGLYWKTQLVIRDPENLSNLTLTESDSNIHKGGLIKIGGTNYVITSVNGMSVTIDGSPAVADLSTRKENASFAVGALIIDHLLTEGNGTAANLVDGYYTDVVNDDGDNIVEKVTTQGYTTFWEANICSRNIPDGAIEIHYVAFDKAGNYASDVVTGTVANNAPRLAGIMYGTDDDGSGTVEDDEMNSDLFAVSTSATGTREGYINSALRTSYLLGTKDSVSVLKIKGATTIKPEIIGGNGTLGYSWSVTRKNETAPYYSQGYKTLSVTGTDYSATGAVAEIQDISIDLSVVDLLSSDVRGETLLDGPNQLFSFTIWDSTTGMTADTNNQRATIEMVADLELQDGVVPNTYIKPFYWKNKSENSVYSKSENGKSSLKGHIDLGSDIGSISSSSANVNDNDDKVSGTIVIEGTAQDNVLIKDIYVQVYTAGNTAGVFNFTGATKVTSGTLNNFYKVAHNEDGTWVSYGTDLSKGWTFSVDAASEKFSQEEGHTIAWKLVLNTEKITNVAQANVKVAVRAQDQGAPTLNGNSITYYQNTSAATSSTKTSGDTTATQTNFNQFDVVPYITGVQTNLSSRKKNNPSVYNRTAQGHYPVLSTETITIAGYNLIGAKYGNTTLTSLTEGEITALPSYYTAAATSFVKLSVNNVTTSGSLQLTNNSIPSLNNLNNNNAKGAAVDEDGQPVTLAKTNYDAYAYNRQPNGDNNNLLTDDVVLDVWQINSEAAKPTSAHATNVVMKINPTNNRIGFAFSSGIIDFCMPNKDNSYDFFQASFDNYTTVGFAYDSAGNSYAVATGGDANAHQADLVNFLSSRWGKSGTSKGGSVYGVNALRIESIGQMSDSNNNGVHNDPGTDELYIDKNRVQSPSIATFNNTGVYLAYYDNINDEIRFRGGTIAANNNGKTNIGTITDDFTGNEMNITGSGAKNVNDGYYYTTKSQIIATQSGSGVLGKAGNYVSIAATGNKNNANNPVVVMVWYDQWNKKLCYSYNDSPNSNRTGVNRTGWSNPIDILNKGGEYCQIAVDAGGGIHIAAYDSGNLMYAYLPSYDSTSVSTCTVDSYDMVGNNLTLDVAKVGDYYVPYIGYYCVSQSAPKYAYLAKPETNKAEGFNGSDDSDEYTGIWETTLIPTGSAVPQETINVGVFKTNQGVRTYSTTDKQAPGAWNIGTNTAGKGTGTCYGNGSDNPVLAYHAKISSNQGYVETAQMK